MARRLWNEWELGLGTRWTVKWEGHLDNLCLFASITQTNCRDLGGVVSTNKTHSPLQDEEHTDCCQCHCYT